MSSDGHRGDSNEARPEGPVIADVVPAREDVVPTYGQSPPPSSNEGCKWIAIGCAAVAVVLLFVLLFAGLWTYRNIKRIAADGVVTISSEAIKQSELPPEQQRQLIRRVEDLGDEFAEGNVTLEQLSEVGEKLVEDESVIVSGVVYFVENQLLDEAPIDEELRTELKLTLQRLARGVIEEKIDLEDLRLLADDLIEKQPDGTIQLKPDLSEDDFVKLLESAKEIAGTAEIPDEPYEVDFLKEVDEVIKEVLEGQEPASIPSVVP